MFLGSHPDHKYIWFRVGISVTFFYTDFPAGRGRAPGIKNVECTTSHRVTRQINCVIAQAPGGHTPPLPEVNFIMVEIPTPKPYIFMIRVNKQIK
jgi:hypothetical protein